MRQKFANFHTLECGKIKHALLICKKNREIDLHHFIPRNLIPQKFWLSTRKNYKLLQKLPWLKVGLNWILLNKTVVKGSLDKKNRCIWWCHVKIVSQYSILHSVVFFGWSNQVATYLLICRHHLCQYFRCIYKIQHVGYNGNRCKYLILNHFWKSIWFWKLRVLGFQGFTKYQLDLSI